LAKKQKKFLLEIVAGTAGLRRAQPDSFRSGYSSGRGEKECAEKRREQGDPGADAALKGYERRFESFDQTGSEDRNRLFYGALESA